MTTYALRDETLTPVARRVAAIRDKMIDLLERRIAGSDQLTPTKRAELRGRLPEKPGPNRHLRATKTGPLGVDKTEINTETALTHPGSGGGS